MTPVSIFWLLVVVIVASLAGFAFAVLRLKQRQKYRLHRGRYFRLATEIIRLDDSPIELAVILRSMGATMDDFTSLKLVVLRAVFNYTPPIRGESAKGLLDRLDAAPKHVMRRFLVAYKEAVMAVSYRSLLFGYLIRRNLCKPPRKPDGFSRSVLLGLVRRGEKHKMNPALEHLDGIAA